MNRKKRFLCAIGCLISGLILMAYGSVSFGTTYPAPWKCVSIAPACGKYTTCASFI